MSDRPKLTDRQLTLMKEINVRRYELHGSNIFDHFSSYTDEEFVKHYMHGIKEDFDMYTFNASLHRFMTKARDLERAWFNCHYGVAEEVNNELFKQLVPLLFGEFEEKFMKATTAYQAMKKEFDKGGFDEGEKGSSVTQTNKDI